MPFAASGTSAVSSCPNSYHHYVVRIGRVGMNSAGCLLCVWPCRRCDWESYLQKALPACRYCIMAREILLSKKTEQGLRLDPRTKLLLIFIISIFVMGGTGGEAMGLIRLVLCTVPAILLLTSKQCAKAVGYIAVFSAFYAVQIYVLPHLTGILNFLVLFTTGFFCRILQSTLPYSFHGSGKWEQSCQTPRC